MVQIGMKTAISLHSITIGSHDSNNRAITAAAEKRKITAERRGKGHR